MINFILNVIIINRFQCFQIDEWSKKIRRESRGIDRQIRGKINTNINIRVISHDMALKMVKYIF